METGATTRDYRSRALTPYNPTTQSCRAVLRAWCNPAWRRIGRDGLPCCLQALHLWRTLQISLDGDGMRHGWEDAFLETARTIRTRCVRSEHDVDGQDPMKKSRRQGTRVGDTR